MMQTASENSTANRNEIIKKICELLSGELVLFTKTLYMHAYSENCSFNNQQYMFDMQYNETINIIETVASGIRSLGHCAHGALQISVLPGKNNNHGNSNLYIQSLLEGHDAIIKFLKEPAVGKTSLHMDAGTKLCFTNLVETHEKKSWKLRSQLS